MTELVRDEVVVPGTARALWAILHDPTALALVVPGAEEIEQVGPDRFRGVLASRLQFITVRANVEATLADARPERHIRLDLTGRPIGLAGSFRVAVPFDIEELAGPDGSPSVHISYSVDLTVTGRLAAFGAPLMRSTLRSQIAELVQNLERELAARAA